MKDNNVEIAQAAIADAYADEDKRYCLIVFVVQRDGRVSQELFTDVRPHTLAEQFRELAERLESGPMVVVGKGAKGEPS